MPVSCRTNKTSGRLSSIEFDARAKVSSERIAKQLPARLAAPAVNS
jgi:hypothetical protein